MNCGLIGYPLGHSYSPQIHRALADYDYRLWPLKPEELEAFLVKRDFAGINVTIPYKERVIPYLDQLSDTARAIGAVNTVVNRDGKLYGDNTDIAGMLALIRRMGLVLSGKKVLILGTGGTSKTARAAASQLGAAEVYRVSRSGRDGAVTYRQAEKEHRDAACIINTTPCGMYPDLGGCPVELDGFPCLEGVVDVIYNPLRSELVLGARQRGIPAEGGLYMLAAQAAYASALFRGCEATAGDIELAYRTVLRQMENIVLIGMPTSGKTTVGQLLSQRTGKTFMDTDAMVEQAVGMTIPAYFAAEGESAKLLLSKNFRSRDTVLDAANFVFRNVLSREMGELDYGEDESLHVGASYPENPDCCTEFHFVEMSAQESDTEKLRAARAEASFAADYIQRLIAGGFTVQDDKTHEPRTVREEDIVILMRSPRTRLADYRRALESRGLHCAAESDGGFYETMEVAVTFALLEILDNPRQDVPLISVLRSPLFGFTPDRLAELRAKTPGGDFYDALAADGDEDSARFLALLRELRESAQTLTLTELVAALYERCHIPAVFGAMRGGAARRENLRAFFSLAEEFERGGGRGLFAFVRHLREQLESGEPPAPQTTHAAQI